MAYPVGLYEYVFEDEFRAAIERGEQPSQQAIADRISTIRKLERSSRFVKSKLTHEGMFMLQAKMNRDSRFEPDGCFGPFYTFWESLSIGDQFDLAEVFATWLPSTTISAAGRPKGTRQSDALSEREDQIAAEAIELKANSVSSSPKPIVLTLKRAVQERVRSYFEAEGELIGAKPGRLRVRGWPYEEMVVDRVYRKAREQLRQRK